MPYNIRKMKRNFIPSKVEVKVTIARVIKCFSSESSSTRPSADTVTN